MVQPESDPLLSLLRLPVAPGNRRTGQEQRRALNLLEASGDFLPDWLNLAGKMFSHFQIVWTGQKRSNFCLAKVCFWPSIIRVPLTQPEGAADCSLYSELYRLFRLYCPNSQPLGQLFYVISQ